MLQSTLHLWSDCVNQKHLWPYQYLGIQLRYLESSGM